MAYSEYLNSAVKHGSKSSDLSRKSDDQVFGGAVGLEHLQLGSLNYLYPPIIYQSPKFSPQNIHGCSLEQFTETQQLKWSRKQKLYPLGEKMYPRGRNRRRSRYKANVTYDYLTLPPTLASSWIHFTCKRIQHVSFLSDILSRKVRKPIHNDITRRRQGVTTDFLLVESHFHTR